MTENTAMSSVISRTINTTVHDEDTIVEKISQATDYLNLLESHLVLLKAKIAKERQSQETNQLTFGESTESTEISQTFCDQVLELWTEVQNYKIRVQNETNKFFNVLVPEVLGEPLSNPENENFRRQITELGDLITPLQKNEMELTYEKQQLELQLMEKQRESIKLIAEVGDRLEQAASHTPSRQSQRNKEKLMKIKIARFVINSFLAQANIDYEKNPYLMDLKIKWRDPISVKAKTD